MKKPSVSEFRKMLEEGIASVAAEAKLNVASPRERREAFSIWVADLIAKAEIGFEEEPDAYRLDDRGPLVFVFEDPANKALLIVYADFVAGGRASSIEEILGFMDLHDALMRGDPVLADRTSTAPVRLEDFVEQISTGWQVEYRFVSTGKAPAGAMELAIDSSRKAQDRAEAATFTYQDEGELKNYLLQALSQGESVPDEVSFSLPANSFILKEEPYRTLIAAIKGNTLRDLFAEHRESLFTWNIRGYLGSRGINSGIIETAKTEPADFFYFNNGVSAICTNLEVDGNHITARNFQVINGAQTITSLVRAPESNLVEVLFRLTEAESVKTIERGLNEKIVRFNNLQNLVKVSDFRSNDAIQYFLEKSFGLKRARGGLPEFRYVRRRTDRKGTGRGLKLEDLAKIRYSFLEEPTLVHSDPKALWSRDDSGAYDKAFGVSGKLEPAWSKATLDEAYLATALYFAIDDDFRKRGAAKTNLQFLGRLRYHALSLAGIQVRQDLAPEEYEDTWRNARQFEAFTNEFLLTARQALIGEKRLADERQMTMFAFVRSADRWRSLVATFSDQLDAR